MSQIYVQKVNESHLKVHADDDVIEEISTFFTFKVPDAQFHPLFKERKWDGLKRLFNKRTKYLPVGLLGLLETFAKDRNYVILGNQYQSETWHITDTAALIATLQLSAHGEPIVAHEHQINGITKALRYKRRTLISSTSSGKSLIAYVIVRQLLQKGLRGLIIVPTIGLVTQMANDFTDYSSINGWDAEGSIHKIFAGQEKKTKKPLVISTWQSLYDLKDDKWFEQFDFIIGDEAQGFQAKSLGKLMDALVNCTYRIGMTGTLQDAKVHSLTIIGHFGPVLTVATNKEMMDKKISADLTIKCLVLKHSADDSYLVSQMNYHEEMEYLTQSERRNNFIRNLALSLNGNTLILFQFIDKHGKILFDKINKRLNDPNRLVYFVHGGTDIEDRETIRKIVEKETNAIIVASYGVFSTGVSIRNLHSIIFASPSKSKIRVLQSIGRGLRISETKSTMTLYDISDDLRVDNHVNYTLLHYVERIKLYHMEKFLVKIYNINLTGG